ncbi:MAG: hypothetical protein HOP91_04470 [Sphingomonas sp.]|nr:hypothetical protein [Sphingomonas sp.]
MNVDDGLALTPTAEGLWSDGWLAARSRLPILLYDAAEAVLVQLWLPADSTPRTARVTSGSWTSEIVMIPDQTVTVQVPVKRTAGSMIIEIEIPDASPAAPPDVRTVGAVLAGIRRLPGAPR